MGSGLDASRQKLEAQHLTPPNGEKNVAWEEYRERLVDEVGGNERRRL